MWQDIRKTSSVQVIVGTKIRDFIKPCLLVVMYYGLNNKLYSCQENSNTTSFSWRTKSTFSLSVLCTYQGTEWILRAQNMPKVSLRTPWIRGSVSGTTGALWVLSLPVVATAAVSTTRQAEHKAGEVPGLSEGFWAPTPWGCVCGGTEGKKTCQVLCGGGWGRGRFKTVGSHMMPALRARHRAGAATDRARARAVCAPVVVEGRARRSACSVSGQPALHACFALQQVWVAGLMEVTARSQERSPCLFAHLPLLGRYKALAVAGEGCEKREKGIHASSPSKVKSSEVL